MSESRSCGTCGRYVDLPVEDGDPGDRIGVCPCAWLVDLAESRPLFDGLYPDDDACEMWVPEQSGEQLVRCRDCWNCAVAADGSGPYCAHWSRRVPWDGYCHLGERKEER